jgi:hypothetical protein
MKNSVTILAQNIAFLGFLQQGIKRVAMRNSPRNSKLFFAGVTMMKTERPDIRESATLARCLAHRFTELHSHFCLATFVLASSHLLDFGNILWMVVPVYS